MPVEGARQSSAMPTVKQRRGTLLALALGTRYVHCAVEQIHLALGVRRFPPETKRCYLHNFAQFAQLAHIIPTTCRSAVRHSFFHLHQYCFTLYRRGSKAPRQSPACVFLRARTAPRYTTAQHRSGAPRSHRHASAAQRSGARRTGAVRARHSAARRPMQLGCFLCRRAWSHSPPRLPRLAP